MGRAQAGRPVIANVEQARHFDFWLGEWDVTWDEGRTAASSVYLDFDDRVVIESWDERPQSELQGMSLSLYDEGAGVWRSTWVDSAGTYVCLSGGFDGEGMELCSDGGEPRRRARWFDIRPDSFTWTMEFSDDGGSTWWLERELDYRRVV
jgi:hypothetical protein